MRFGGGAYYGAHAPYNNQGPRVGHTRASLAPQGHNPVVPEATKPAVPASNYHFRDNVIPTNDGFSQPPGRQQPAQQFGSRNPILNPPAYVAPRGPASGRRNHGSGVAQGMRFGLGSGGELQPRGKKHIGPAPRNPILHPPSFVAARGPYSGRKNAESKDPVAKVAIRTYKTNQSQMGNPIIGSDNTQQPLPQQVSRKGGVTGYQGGTSNLLHFSPQASTSPSGPFDVVKRSYRSNETSSELASALTAPQHVPITHVPPASGAKPSTVQRHFDKQSFLQASREVALQQQQYSPYTRNHTSSELLSTMYGQDNGPCKAAPSLAYPGNSQAFGTLVSEHTANPHQAIGHSPATNPTSTRSPPSHVASTQSPPSHNYQSPLVNQEGAAANHSTLRKHYRTPQKRSLAYGSPNGARQDAVPGASPYSSPYSSNTITRGSPQGNDGHGAVSPGRSPRRNRPSDPARLSQLSQPYPWKRSPKVDLTRPAPNPRFSVATKRGEDPPKYAKQWQAVPVDRFGLPVEPEPGKQQHRNRRHRGKVGVHRRFAPGGSRYENLLGASPNRRRVL